LYWAGEDCGGAQSTLIVTGPLAEAAAGPGLLVPLEQAAIALTPKTAAMQLAVLLLSFGLGIDRSFLENIDSSTYVYG
jgi:hypothetical protein